MNAWKSLVFRLLPLCGLALVTSCGPLEEGQEPAEQSSASLTSAATSSSLNVPTKWTLVNNTRQSLTFSCSCPKPRGLSSPIVMTTTTVTAGATKVVNWGDWWYNDGLGLNACSWNCSAKRAGTAYASTTFTTDWGENITIRAKSTGGLAIER